MKGLTLLSFLFISTAVQSNTYYNELNDNRVTHISSIELRDRLNRIISSSHRKNLNYREAKAYLFGKVHLERENNGTYFVEDVYCHNIYSEKRHQIGPMRVPNHEIVNAEHTWPQSRFSRNVNKNTQKTDLHHLFPTESRANSRRGNHEFGEAGRSAEPATRDCTDSKYGVGSGGQTVFEPPHDHKGNAARALFYFSVRYKISISSSEERILRKWHREDPVDFEEMRRNEMIQEIQGNRNPFIDYPEMVSQISDF